MLLQTRRGFSSSTAPRRKSGNTSGKLCNNCPFLSLTNRLTPSDVGTAFDDPTWPVDNEFPKVPPQIDVKHPDITCGRSAFKFAATTETADVLAGSEVGFRVSWDGSGKYGTFWHPGPAQIYLSRAPNDDVEHYEGDGDWFKIAYAGPINNARWQLQSEGDVGFWISSLLQLRRNVLTINQFNFTIPQTTPPGKYLLRIEQFMPTEEFNYSQWYVNCAHVNIIGPGGGKPTEFAKFPGTYRIDDPVQYSNAFELRKCFNFAP